MRKRRKNKRNRGLPRYAADVEKVARRALDEGRTVPGNVYLIDVVHDGWCDLLAGKGPCNCNPEVRGEPYTPRELSHMVN